MDDRVVIINAFSGSSFPPPPMLLSFVTVVIWSRKSFFQKMGRCVAKVPCLSSTLRKRDGWLARVWLLLASLILQSIPARAVIFHSTGDINFNTAAPTGQLADSGWQWVGNWNGFQGTAIGPNQFVTARHIGGSVGASFQLNGVGYVTTAAFDDAGSDLRVWKVSGTFPSWAPVYRTNDEEGRTMVAFGRGMIRGSEVKVGSVLKGWTYAPGDGRLRWGTNTVRGTSYGGAYWGELLYASFDATEGPNEAHLATGDSGGPVFVNNGSGWKLAGVAAYVTAFFNTSSSGTGFMAALFDIRELYYGGEAGPWSLIANPTPLASSFYVTRVSQRLAWIDSVIAAAVAPVITAQPVSSAVTAGATVSFSVTASGSPAPAYLWRKDGVAIGGATAPSLTLSGVQAGNAGGYSVVVTNSAGTVTSTVATLTVNPAAVAPTIANQPVSQTATAGGSVSFSVAATGSPTLTYQWSKNGVPIAGATGSSLSWSAVHAADAGSFTVMVANTAGNVTSNAATLTVNPAPMAPIVATQPVSQSATVGAAVTLTVVASGIPAPTYQWKREGVEVAGATASSLTLNTIQVSQAGNYTVVVTNTVGSVTSDAATIAVNRAAVAPAIATHPISQTVTAGTTVVFSVGASGSPAPTYQWRKDGVVISGATTSSLTLNSVQPGNGGDYSAIVTNSAGTVASSAATLTVNPVPVAPTIASHPLSQLASTGANVVFTVTATGMPAPTYQWTKEGAIIAGATAAALTLGGIEASAAGIYRVMATNALGTAYSSPATLEIRPTALQLPAITRQPENGSARVGTSFGFRVEAVGAAPLFFQWYKEGSIVPAATGAVLAIPAVTLSDRGSYSVVISNLFGTVTSNAVTLAVKRSPRLSNLSVRAFAGSGNESLILGFVSEGSLSQSLLVRAVGPGLAPFGVSGRASDPKFSIRSGDQNVGENDDWGGDLLLSETFSQVGAFSLRSDSKDAAILRSLVPGGYTAHVSSGDSTKGVVLAEIYDVGGQPPSARLVNLSVRNFVGTGERALIVGFVVSGDEAQTVIIRGIGATLAAFGVSGVLQDPSIRLYSEGSILAENDDWAGTDELARAFSEVGAFALPRASTDAALRVTLSPGPYTVQISGKGDSSGVTLLEVYAVP